ncbi:thiamine phosphate synthase, partial [Chromobacterium violaceum]
ELARAALAAGASYVAFGAVFPSRTKPHAAAAPLSLFADAAALGANAVAIGGITAGNAGRAVEAGADAIAVIGGLFDADDTAAAARALAGWFGAR